MRTSGDYDYMAKIFSEPRPWPVDQMRAIDAGPMTKEKIRAFIASVPDEMRGYLAHRIADWPSGGYVLWCGGTFYHRQTITKLKQLAEETGISSPYEIARYGATRLLHYKGIGKVTVEDIRQSLMAGFYLKLTP